MDTFYCLVPLTRDIEYSIHSFVVTIMIIILHLDIK